MTPQLQREFSALAETLPGIDRTVYAEYGKDPLVPIFGEGAADAPLAFFGRDPGRDEVRHGLPFVGAGGQKIRAALHQHLYGQPLPDFAASLEAGRPFFWANTVPYKPIGNKAWSIKIKRQFQPLVAELLLSHWQGQDIITLGREAFFWFALNQDKAVQARLDAFWARDDRFERSVEMHLSARAGGARTLRLHPLPHPSPLNATWYKHFPDLLAARLAQLKVSIDHDPCRDPGHDHGPA